MKKNILAIGAGVVGSAMAATSSFAAFTLPDMPVTDLETAGATVAAFVAVMVVIGGVIRLIKKA